MRRALETLVGAVALAAAIIVEHLESRRARR